MIEQSVSLASNGVVKVPGYEQLVRFGYTKNRGVYRLHVDATGEWEGLTVRCFWHVPDGKDPASTLVQDGLVDVPASVTAQPGNGCITFEGSDGTRTVTSADLRYRVAANSGTDDGSMPEPGTPAWQELVGAVHTDATAAEQAKTDAEGSAKRADASATKAAASEKAAGDAQKKAAESLQELKNGIESGNFKGEPGVSPTVTVQDITGGHRIVITDATGTSFVDVLNGKQGDPGKPGDTGATPELTIGTVKEGDAPSATITGTVKKPILNLTLKSGAPGKDATVDTTLTHEGEAADAKATGDAISAVKVRQNILIGTETGNPISVDDAFSSPLCGLTVYGRSTQDGTPTPEAPVPIVSAGDGGSVVVKVTGKNLFPVVTNANLSKINKPTGGVRYGYVFYVPVKSRVTASGNADIGMNCFVGDFDIKTQTYTQIAQLISERGGTYAATLQSGWYVIYMANDYLPTILIKLNDAKIQLEIGTEATVYEPYHEQLLTLPTPTGLHGIPVTSSGNYTDPQGQQWVCDEVDLERGVKVQRVNAVDLSTCVITGNTNLTATKRLSIRLPLKGKDYTAKALCNRLPYLVSFTNDTIHFYVDVNNAQVFIPIGAKNPEEGEYILFYILDAPIETPLTPDEIAAYKALTSYAPDTVVQAGDGAGVKLGYQRDVNIVVKNLEDAIASMTAT